MSGATEGAVAAACAATSSAPTSSAAASSAAPTAGTPESSEGCVLELNVGGILYHTTQVTLCSVPGSRLAALFSSLPPSGMSVDAKGRYFFDRDGILFRYVLDFLRNARLVLPENFNERDRLAQEALYFKLPKMQKELLPASSEVAPEAIDKLTITDGKPSSSSCITISYRGTFAFGRDGLADVKFRKLNRMLVCGRVSSCRDVFGETLNESRDPDRANDRYSARFFLKHTFLEQAIDMLLDAGYRLAASCGSGTNAAAPVSAGQQPKPGHDSEENRWQHYNEFIFTRI